MVASDLVFYKAIGTDGGTISTTVVETGVLNSLLGDIAPSTAESGGEVFNKCFVKNTNATDTAYNLDICLSKYPDGDDITQLFFGTASDTTTDYNTSKLYGIAETTAELDRGTKVVPISCKLVNAVDVFDVGDKITFLDKTTNEKIVKLTIASVTNSDITVVEDLPASYVLDNTWVANTLEVGNFIAGEEQAFWVKRKIPPFATTMEVPPDSLFVDVIFDDVVTS